MPNNLFDNLFDEKSQQLKKIKTKEEKNNVNTFVEYFEKSTVKKVWKAKERKQCLITLITINEEGQRKKSVIILK